ncbi:MAG TPA: L-threonylcarbamoyladenylate synthase [Thermoanaerobaculia bacterium]|nr:L-threonylcarbamoyladenylate synthase [Thermoanaerobaculia bacterium]
MRGYWHWDEPVEPLRELLRRGGVLAIPTESSYGLGADPRNPKGVEAIYRIKGREPRKALPVVVADLGQLADLGIDPGLSILRPLSACWPGPLTVLLPLLEPWQELPAAAGEPSLAVRIPGHDRLRELLGALGHGLTATSANVSGREPVLDPAEAAKLLAGEDGMVVDGGVLPGGPPSTVVAIEEAGPVVLRTGVFPVERLREALRQSGLLRTAQGEEV